MPAKFCGLPEELTVRIFENLDGRDLISCSLVCRLCRAIIHDASALQYNIELTIAGVEDRGLASRFTIAERLSELKTVQESWASLRFRKREARSMPMSNVWELFGGFFARGVSTAGTRGLAFFELPSAARGTPGRTWEHRDLGVTIRDFTIDPTQDLVVLISFAVEGVHTLHLRAMSTGHNHPLAAEEALSCATNRVRLCNFVIQIMGEFLAVLFHTVDWRAIDQLIVWNWHTGKVVAELKAPLRKQRRIDSFSFLSPRHFVLARFHFELPSTTVPVLEVYDFLTHDPSQPSTPTPTLVRSFAFPEMDDYGVVRSMLTRSDPPPQCPALSPDSTAPFATALESRVLAVTLEIVRQRQSNCNYVLFVHHSALLEGLVDGQAPDVVPIPWEEWGPAKSRMLQTLSNEPTWVCYIHGTRYVRLEPSEQPFSHRIRMLDFNPGMFYRNSRKGDDEEGTPRRDEVYSTADATRIPALNVFENDVVTTLPYREVYSSENFDYHAVMIDEECLVGMVPGEMGYSEGFEFLCF